MKTVPKRSKSYNISGKNIKRIRKNKHLNQENLAVKMQLNGVSMAPSTVSKIESSDRTVSDKELLAFSKVLETSPQELLGDDKKSLTSYAIN